jgi:hypothetical protein
MGEKRSLFSIEAFRYCRQFMPQGNLPFDRRQTAALCQMGNPVAQGSRMPGRGPRNGVLIIRRGVPGIHQRLHRSSAAGHNSAQQVWIEA